MEFREHFCLKDRHSFTIDAAINAEDARFYFGRPETKERLQKQLRRSFTQPGVPKIVVFGPYGSGKTQTLYYMEHLLLNGEVTSCRLKPRTVHYNLDIHGNSNAGDWHLQMLEALGKDAVTQWVGSLFEKVADLRGELAVLFDGDSNMVAAANRLREPAGPGMTAWRWLAGQKLSNPELETLGVTRNLGTTGASDFVSVLVGVGRLAQRNDETVIFFVDEAEQLHDAGKADCIESLKDYMRKLAEPANNSVGIVVGAMGHTLDDLAASLMHDSVTSRIGKQNYIELTFMAAVDTVHSFLSEMLGELIDRDAAEKRIHEDKLGVTLDTYPFTDEAFGLFCTYASEDPSKALPRQIIMALNECAIEAWDQGKATVDESIVNDTCPIVFG